MYGQHLKSRRQFLQTTAAGCLAAAGFGNAWAQGTAGAQRIERLDPALDRILSTSQPIVELGSGYGGPLGPAEGPLWWKEGGYLLFSDIPNNRIMKFDEKTGKTTVFREKANFANGNTRDRQGRLITCEHGGRRVTRTEYDGSVSVLADQFEGKRLNSPNDIV
mgnify:CR=1 FL=1